MLDARPEELKEFWPENEETRAPASEVWTIDKTWTSVGLTLLICKMKLDEMTPRALADVLGFGLVIEC